MTSSIAHVSWSDIEGFASVRKHVQHYPHLSRDAVVRYRAKVKLHGTNAAIQCYPDGTIVAQSRETILGFDGVTDKFNDNAGFARWVKDTEEFWRGKRNMVIFGEWCGPGVQAGVAVNQIPQKTFAVFAARSLHNPDFLMVEPGVLEVLVSGIPNVHVLPWHEPTIDVDWTKTSEELQPVADLINKYVLVVEECDPWVETTFGIKGTGEGLVFYPVSKQHLGKENFSNLAFKAKGEAHRVVKAKVAVQVDPSVAASIDEFVSLVLPEPRLLQGASLVNGAQGFQKSLTGKFVGWVASDVNKECQAELVASSLEWKDVQKAVSDRARKWYLAKAEE